MKPAPGGSYPLGYCHFPKYGEEYFKQLTAERLVTVKDKRAPHREWRKLRERNEALDCRVYARAAASAVGIDRFAEQHWAELENLLGNAGVPAMSQPPRRQMPAGRQGWLDGERRRGWLK